MPCRAFVLGLWWILLIRFSVDESSVMLFTPEILCRIFGRLGHACNYRNALVCRGWSLVATRVLWNDVGLDVFISLGNIIVTELGSVVSFLSYIVESVC